MGRVPDGVYRWIQTVQPILTAWAPDRLRRLADSIERAEKEPNSRKAVDKAIRREPELRRAAKQLLIPKDAGQFWAFVAVLLAAIALVLSQQSSDAPATPQGPATGTGQPASQPTAEPEPPPSGHHSAPPR